MVDEKENPDGRNVVLLVVVLIGNSSILSLRSPVESNVKWDGLLCNSSTNIASAMLAKEELKVAMF